MIKQQECLTNFKEVHLLLNWIFCIVLLYYYNISYLLLVDNEIKIIMGWTCSSGVGEAKKEYEWDWLRIMSSDRLWY
jgi:hypothetical protein